MNVMRVTPVEENLFKDWTVASVAEVYTLGNRKGRRKGNRTANVGAWRLNGSDND